MTTLLLLFFFSSEVFSVAGQSEALAGLPLLRGLREVLLGHPGVTVDSLPQILTNALTTVAAEEKLDIDVVACDRDFSGCPKGWALQTGGYCEAPSGYRGSCSNRISLAGLSPKERYAQCNDFEFPCRQRCTEDFSRECPATWQPSGPECLAPEGYTGPCVGRKSFLSIGLQDRKKWGDTCGVSWPCRGGAIEAAKIAMLSKPGVLASTCSYSFAEDCPAGWRKGDRYCHATAFVESPHCGFHVDTTNFTVEAKHAWSVACAAPWPCLQPS